MFSIQHEGDLQQEFVCSMAKCFYVCYDEMTSGGSDGILYAKVTCGINPSPLLLHATWKIEIAPVSK